jgi:uncharacterized protein YmfQ (DUF2313 family)
VPTHYHDPFLRDRRRAGPHGVRFGLPPAHRLLGISRPLEVPDLALDLAPMLQEEPFALAVVRAANNEFKRIAAAATAIQLATFPAQSDDVVLSDSIGVAKILSMWETLLNLPVAPTDVPVVQRRNKVLAHIRKRHSGAGMDWVARMTEALGTSLWVYEEGPGDYQLQIAIPFASGSYTAAQALAFAKKITPAHLEISVLYSQHFLVGISLIGIDPL